MLCLSSMRAWAACHFAGLMRGSYSWALEARFAPDGVGSDAYPNRVFERFPNAMMTPPVADLRRDGMPTVALPSRS
jgi:hypothetical protein